jgi:phosphatidylglycerophosphate synthase
MDVDLASALVLVAAPLLLGVAYRARVALRGRAESARVAREGRSALLTQGAMEMFHWALAPLGALCVRLGVSANAVTYASLALGLTAGVVVADGHLGLGALLAALCAVLDGLDGVVARASLRASSAGEVLDAAVDRYTELALLFGLAVHLRAALPLLVLTLLATAASFMVSYSTAKAEALGVTPPRGSMRRSERAVCLVVGTALVPLAARLGRGLEDAPLVVALAAVALFGNVSAVRRLASIARSVRGREAEAP